MQKSLRVSLVVLAALLSVGVAAFARVPTPSKMTRAAVRKNPKDGAEMALVPAGEFEMGFYDQKDNQPHKVRLSAFYIYKNPVTVAQFKRFCKATDHAMPPAPAFNPNWSKVDHPIVNVTWSEADAYTKWAGVKLPTESQYERAAKGTDGRKYPWGNDFDANKTWRSRKTEGDAGGTTAVGHYTDSPYGLSDMEGNVWQWCADWYDEEFWWNKNRGADPVNTTPGKWRMARGGGWKFRDEWDFNCTERHAADPGDRQDYIGFRCAIRAATP